MKRIATILAMLFAALVIGQTNSLAASMMYWTDLANNKIQRANLDGSGIRDLITTGLGNPQYIALDTAAGKMYWTDSGLDMIRRADLNGSHIEALVTTGLSSPGGIALDIEAGKMYWTDALTHKIQRANLNGNGVEDLVTTGLQWPKCIALDVDAGKMYWADPGTDKIQRANLDGSGVEDLVNAGSSALQGIALDVSAGKMYWADLVKIQRANLDGSSVEFLVTTGGRLRGIALDVAAGKMYWTDTLWYGKIQCANLDGSGVKDLIVGGMNFPLGLALDVPIPIPKHAIIFVDIDAPPGGDGSSWEMAFRCLQDALAVAWYGDEIRVAQGVYKPTERTVRPPSPSDPPLPSIDLQMLSFHLKGGVALKGGYAGFGASDPNARDIELYETILTGDLTGNDREVSDPFDLLNDPCRADNSYHVVTGSGTDKTTVLDGFTITAGNSNHSWAYYRSDRGSGMFNDFGSPTVTNCTFTRNSAESYGGGMYNKSGDPTINNCTFSGNLASSGGGMSNSMSNPTVISCTFSGNLANSVGGGMNNGNLCTPTLKNCTFSGNSAKHGGGMFNYESSPTLTNCTFSGNSARSRGGGIYDYGSLMMINCTFSSNSANDGGGMFIVYNSIPNVANCTFSANSAYQRGGAIYHGFPGPPTINSFRPIITNCIFWGNTPYEIHDDLYLNNKGLLITYSDVKAGWPGVGNIDATPCFVEPGYWDPNGVWIEGDYHLLSGSPCINAGDPNYIAEPNETDLDGKPRVIGGRIDMGSYEFQNTRPLADAGPDQIVECACNNNEGTKVTLDGTGSYDADGDLLTYTWTGPFIESPAQGATPTVTLEDGCPGEYVITLVVNDGTEDSEPNDVMITVVDTTPPEFALSVNSTTLWPPSHQMVKITPTWTVNDNCDAMPGVSLVSISINESNTKGNGRIDDDVKIGDDGSIYLRAERSGAGKDRVYTITYQASDDCGNATLRSATVTVPHDQR